MMTWSVTIGSLSGLGLPTLTMACLPLGIILLLVALRPVLQGLRVDEPSRGSKYRKENLELDSLSSSETIIEWTAMVMTTLQKEVFRWSLKNTRGALVISLLRQRIIMARPCMERVLRRHVDDMSLAHNVEYFGSPMFDLSTDGIQRIKDHNPRPIHKNAFSGSDAARSHIRSAVRFAQDRIDKQPDLQEVLLGDWLFKLVNATLITTIWGPVNPWVSDEDGFVDRFTAFTFALPTLLRPFPQITARRAIEARDQLISQLRSFHFKDGNRHARTQSLAHRLNAVAMSDPQWESNPDYFKVELLTAQGLTITPSAMAVWLMRHLLSDEQLLSKVVSQVRGSPAALLRDGSEIERACPALAASLYETLRLHMTAIPRVVSTSFEEEAPALRAARGDLLVLPMRSFNLDAAVWGPDAARFAPDRFLTEAGRVCPATVRRLRVFGVAGNMCPGRRIGVETVLFVTATVLRAFDIRPAGDGGAGFTPPEPSKEPGIGFERVGGDVRVTKRRVDASRACV